MTTSVTHSCKHLLALPLALLVSLQSYALDIEQLGKILQQKNLLTGEFQQRRELSEIPVPLQSYGQFIYWRDHGMYWETSKPFYSAQTYTPEDIIQWQAPGVALDTAPGMIERQIGQIMVGLFSGDLSRLESFFTATVTGSEDDWRIHFKPSAGSIQNVINHIELQGQTLVNTLSIETANGDLTRIDFRAVNTPSTLSVSECERFFRDPASFCLNRQSID